MAAGHRGPPDVGTKRSHLKSVPAESMFRANIASVLLGLQAGGVQVGVATGVQLGVGLALGDSVNADVGGPSATETLLLSVNSANSTNERHVIRVSIFIELLPFLSFFVNPWLTIDPAGRESGGAPGDTPNGLSATAILPVIERQCQRYFSASDV